MEQTQFLVFITEYYYNDEYNPPLGDDMIV